ncbi:MAG: (E)-4-hydroxy-3-methylbut-2-enyl-diphosphate synthase [Sphaerochaetaceae bacterium]
MINRRKTKSVKVGPLTLGSSFPIAVQTMWSEGLSDPHIFSKIRAYATMGCHLIRFSYPSSDAKEPFTKICQESVLPVVADIHFDYRLALEALECGAAKIRINPGNIGVKWKTKEVVRSALDKGVAVRIGLNGASLPLELRSKDHSEEMVKLALTYLEWFESWGFYNTVISLKDSEPEVTYRAYSAIATECDYPLHLGVTEAGGIVSSMARSTWVLGRLLSQGIGDTLRISISDESEYEIMGAKEILRSVGLESPGIRLVACPRCGRSSFDSHAFLKKVEKRLSQIPLDITVAIMGCQVNGPGEALHADLAITGLAERLFFYEKGVLVKEITPESAEEVLFTRIEELMNER